jgi:hypothetical protein
MEIEKLAEELKEIQSFLGQDRSRGGPMKPLFRGTDPLVSKRRPWPWKPRGPRNRLRCRRPSRIKYRTGKRYPVYFERCTGPFPALKWSYYSFDLTKYGSDHTVIIGRTP